MLWTPRLTIYLLAGLPLIACAQTTEEACRREFDRIAPQCRGAKASRCIEQKMSPGCKDAAAGFIEARKACDEAVERVWQVCKARPADKQAQCFEENRAAARAACN
jgi:hypothetical protein